MPVVKQVIYQYSPLAIQNLIISVYGYYWKNRRYGKTFEKELWKYKLREKFTYSEWENYQNEQLRSILSHAYHNVPLYKEKYAKYGIGLSDIKSFTIRELYKLPPLEKDELRRFGTTKLLSTKREKGGIFLSSSGSTGTPTKILFSRDFHQKWQAAMEARVRNWAGITKDNSRGMIGGRRIIPSAYSKPPFYRYNFFEKQVYFSAYHISPSNLKGYISAFEKYPIDYMTGYAFSNYILAQLIANEGIKVPKIKAVITSSEKLTDGMRKTLETVYNCKTYDSYSGVEACGLISENECGELLISPDVGILEVLKPDGTPCVPGETGEILSTGFLNYDQPLIRYRIGDMVHLSKNQQTACGRNMPKVEEIIGRIEDVITGPDGRKMVRFHGIFINIPSIKTAQVVQKDLYNIEIRLIAENKLKTKEENLILSRITSQLGNINVVLNYVNEIPPGPNGKFKSVISQINTNHGQFKKNDLGN